MVWQACQVIAQNEAPRGVIGRARDRLDLFWRPGWFVRAQPSGFEQIGRKRFMNQVDLKQPSDFIAETEAAEADWLSQVRHQLVADWQNHVSRITDNLQDDLNKVAECRAAADADEAV
jgi:hypothetical protein